MPSLVKAGTNGYKNDRWKARIKIDGKERFIGYFPSRKEALEAERKLRFTLTGDPDTVRNSHKYGRWTRRG